ncbi:50S ribosomal protein L25/general stress protein Ctc [Thiofilum flexile]|uniref:50S ribosomal protein L25/general stress protein Ctc n=1 Tax=Thiofilum flexile TaxID=125627 RepID=UPI00037907BA|nr:50S ribosomal protein L25/general stress protein Ctc [Thiofilum flexile]
MSKTYSLKATKRADQGKGASRRLRHTGAVPAIVYGAGKEPLNITLDHNELVRNLQDEGFYSQLIALDVDGTIETVVLRDLQRHPAKVLVMHADLQRIQADHLIRVSVPLHFINVETSTGVKVQGGALNQLLNNVEVSCLPKDIPSYIEVNMQDVEKGQILHLSNLVLPAGVTLPQLTLGQDHDQAVAAIH